ncbi:S-RNase [Striga asiatica]|uniref:S-RNase n=1 Tax=Striga asiatica TaxID=4170 RepID=A0A5A7NZS5_STRAF|nr:S-RNase [Striga asiatica]
MVPLESVFECTPDLTDGTFPGLEATQIQMPPLSSIITKSPKKKGINYIRMLNQRVFPPFGLHSRIFTSFCDSWDKTQRHDDHAWNDNPNGDGSYLLWVPMTNDIQRFVLHGVRDSKRQKPKPPRPDRTTVIAFKKRMEGYEAKGLISLNYMKYIWPNLGRLRFSRDCDFKFWLTQFNDHASDCGLDEEHYFSLRVKVYNLKSQKIPINIWNAYLYVDNTLQSEEPDMVFLYLQKPRGSNQVLVREVAVRTNRDGTIFRQVPSFIGYFSHWFGLP